MYPNYFPLSDCDHAPVRVLTDNAGYPYVKECLCGVARVPLDRNGQAIMCPMTMACLDGVPTCPMCKAREVYREQYRARQKSDDARAGEPTEQACADCEGKPCNCTFP